MNYGLTDFLHKKASLNKVPLMATFELSPVCNFSCKMCYVRKTYHQIQKEGKQLINWKQWYELGKKCIEAGTLYILFTGGEPFLYPGFKELYCSLHKLGAVISINSNATLIDEETIAWLKEQSPSRINITLYGSSKETYKRICGDENGYVKAINAIKMLKEVGIPVVINASMIPENADDMEDIIHFGKQNNLNTRVATYMFPPMKRDHELTDSRFDSKTSAYMSLKRVKCMLDEQSFKNYCKEKLKTLDHNESSLEDDWGLHKDEHMRCRAGRSAFWVSWEGKMTACGLTSFPITVNPFEEDFMTCWNKLTNKVRETTVLKECSVCNKKEICKPCVAMLSSEVNDVNKKSKYLCDMSDYLIDLMRKEIDD